MQVNPCSVCSNLCNLSPVLCWLAKGAWRTKMLGDPPQGPVVAGPLVTLWRASARRATFLEVTPAMEMRPLRVM